MYAAANEFLASYTRLEDLRAAAESNPTMRVESSGSLTNSDYEVGALGYSNDTRDMICWAFSADVGDVSPQVYTFTAPNGFYDSRYVVAALASQEDAGLPSVDAVRADIELPVINAKKANLLKERIGSQADLRVVANQFQLPVDTAASVSFTQSFVPGLGGEPKVIAEATRLPLNQNSAPIAGEAGLYLVQAIESVGGAATPVDQLKRQMTLTARSQAGSQLLPSLRQNADVEDLRSTFECSNL